MKMKEHKKRPRSSYHNKESYDDTVELIEELLEAELGIEVLLDEAFEELLDEYIDLYERYLPFYFKDGVNYKELNNLIESLRNGRAPATELSRAMDELERNIRVLQNDYTTAWLILDYELTKQETGLSLGLDPYSSFTMTYMSQVNVRDDIVTKSWCPDNKTFNERIWDNTRDMDLNLRKVIVQGFRRGWDVNRMTQILQNITGMAAYKARRLIRTETLAVWSKTTKEMYLMEGIKYIEIIGDAACGGICNDYVGNIITLEEAEVGDELPPYHPNCCCSYCSYDEFEGKDEQEEFADFDNIVEG